MAGFVELDDAQQQRLQQLLLALQQRRLVMLANARSRAVVLLADALLRRPPQRRVQAERQARLLRAKADALEQALDQAATRRWHEDLARRALLGLELPR